MVNVQALKQRRIGRVMVGLALATASGSIAFVSYDGRTSVAPATQQRITGPAADAAAVPLAGPWELYHMEGAPPMQPAADVEPTGAAPVQGPWELYHMEGAPPMQPAADVEPTGAAPVQGPWELYHMEGAPPIQSGTITDDGTVPTLWDLYHCSGCP